MTKIKFLCNTIFTDINRLNNLFNIKHKVHSKTKKKNKTRRPLKYFLEKKKQQPQHL